MRILVAASALVLFNAVAYAQIQASAECRFDVLPPWTVSRLFSKSDCVVYAQWDGRLDAEGRAVVRVLNSAHVRGDDAPKRGALITLWKYEPNTRLLLVGGRRSEATGTQAVQWTWESSRPASRAVFDYFKEIPPKSDTHHRNSYLARFLQHENSAIAGDAFIELKNLGSSDLASARSLKSTVPTSEQLRKWLMDPIVPDERKGFYALLFGLRGNASDRDFLLSTFMRWRAENRSGLDHALTGHVLLKGEAGLQDISRLVIRQVQDPDGRSWSEKKAAVQAVQTLLSEAKPRVRRPILLASLYPLIAEDVGQIVIPILVRYRDWSQLDAIKGVAEKPDVQSVLKYECIRYMLCAHRDTQAPKPLRDKAAKYLEIIWPDD